MKHHIPILVGITILIVLTTSNVFAQYGGGTGQPESPYLIYTPEHLNMIGTDSNDWNKCFKLMADINMADYNGTQYNLIGNSIKLFIGTFDGNDHVVSNLTYISETTDYVGMFGHTGSGAQIRNLGLEDINIVGQIHVGGLIGRNYGSNVTNCFAEGTVDGNTNVGGLIGVNSGINGSDITQCYFIGSIYGDQKVGGLIGVNANGATVSHCYAICDVQGNDYDIGGLIGSSGGPVSDCYSSGTVIGNDDTGGLIGDNTDSVNSCYSTSHVSGSSNTGGLIGFNRDYKIVAACYSTGTVNAASLVGGLIGNNYGFVNNCRSTGSVHGTGDWVGGLIGCNGTHGTLWNCYSTANVEGDRYVGGLVGIHQGYEVRRSYSEGMVIGNLYVGGLIGNNDNTYVSDCYSISDVNGNDCTGGLVGENHYTYVANCYSAGPVSGITNTGGLIGKRTYSTVSACFWDIDTSEQTNGVGLTVGSSSDVYGRSTAQMKQQVTFTSSPYLWDFLEESTNGTDDYWRICVDDVNYPRLTWEHIQNGDYACPDGVDYDDLSLLSDDWLVTYSRELYGADADGDKKVNFMDFAIFAGKWLVDF